MASHAERVRDLLKQSEWIEQAADRARDLEVEVPVAHKYFGLLGAQPEVGTFELVDRICWIRCVTNPPGAVHLFSSADLSKPDVHGISRYSGSIRSEIAVNDDGAEPGLFDFGWHVAVLLKIRGHHRLTCPAMSTVSWDVVAAKKNANLSYRMLDDVPRTIAFKDTPQKVSLADLEWVRNNIDRAYRLREAGFSRRFTLALGIAYSWNHTSDVRMSITSIWAALEALFGDKADRGVRKSVARRISDWTRQKSSKDVEDLYDLRCDAVHGRDLSDAILADALRDSSSLLDNSLVLCIEREEVPLSDWHVP